MIGGFGYDPAIIEHFPGIRGGVIHAIWLQNGPSPPTLLARYRSEQEEVNRRIGDTPLSELPSISTWRRTFAAFGVKPTQYRNAAESLLRRLTKQGDIPSINCLVDMANLISIRHRLPIAIFDQQAVTGATTVRFATGEESFTDLGSDTRSHPEEGEVIFVDEADLVSARRWCWRQSAQSAAGPGTTDALITIEGLHEDAEEDVMAATDDLLELITEHQPGAVTTRSLLSPEAPQFAFPNT